MSKALNEDPHVYAHALCEEAASEKRILLAEVFVRVAESWRSEWHDRERSIRQFRRETGVALRVWDQEGHEGFVHADDIVHRSPGDLTRTALELLELQRGSPTRLVPRLPGGDAETPAKQEPGDGAPGSTAEADRPAVAARLAGCLEAARAAFEVRGHRPYLPFQIEVERGLGRTWVVNSLGRDVSFPFAGGSASVQARAGNSTMRYEAVLGLGDLRPEDFVATVEREAESLLGSAVVPMSSAPVVFSPRAAALWLSWVAAHFVKGPESQEGRLSILPFRRGFHIVDDESADPFDGEGRAARARAYLRNGQWSDRIVDSRDLSARVEDLGPMRRDSFRDAPSPGPLSLAVRAAAITPSALDQLNRGLHVTSLTPRAAPGSDTFLAEVRGQWIEQGRPPRAIGATLLKLDEQGGLGRVVAWGADHEAGPPGVPVRAPSLLFDRAVLIHL